MTSKKEPVTFEKSVNGENVRIIIHGDAPNVINELKKKLGEDR